MERKRWTVLMFLIILNHTLIWRDKVFKKTYNLTVYIYFSIWVFCHEHPRFTVQQGKGEAISLTPLYYFQLHHRHLDINLAIVR